MTPSDSPCYTIDMTNWTVTIKKTGLYLITVGIHGYLAAYSKCSFMINGMSYPPQFDFSNPTSGTVQCKTTISTFEYIPAGTVLSIRLSGLNGTGAIYGGNTSNSTFWDIVNLSEIS